MKRVSLEGKTYNVPDDASMDEIDQVIKGQSTAPPAGPAPAIPPTAGIAPAPKPQGFGANLSQWASDAADDMRLGTGRTLPGRVLQSVHATPLNEGVSPKTADYMGSPVLGTLRATQGAGELMQPGKRMQGLRDVGGGIADAAQMPMSLFPESMGVGAAADEASHIPNPFPNTASAGRKFDAAMAKAKDVPVDVSHFAQPVLRAKHINAVAGDPMAPVMRKALQDIGPTTEPLTYGDARILASSAGRKAQQAAMAPAQLTGEMGKRLGETASGLDTATAEAAERAGAGPEHNAAMREYRNAMRIRNGLTTAGKIGVPIAVGGGILGAIGRKMLSN